MPAVVIYPHPIPGVRVNNQVWGGTLQHGSGVRLWCQEGDGVSRPCMALRLDGNDVASVNSQDVRCTGLVDFSMEYVDRTCTVWQTWGPASSQSDSDTEPVAVTVFGTKEFLTSLRELHDIGPDHLDTEINVELTEPCGRMDESGPLTIHKVYAVGREEEDSKIWGA